MREPVRELGSEPRTTESIAGSAQTNRRATGRISLLLLLLPGFAAPARAQTEIKLTASDAGAADGFGAAVAIDGDTIAVGAPFDDEGGAQAGAVYVLQRQGGQWIEEIKLLAADAQAGDELGAAVAIEGDFVVAGARFDDDVGQNSGAAYVFQRVGAMWTQQKLTAFDAGTSDRFGASVAIDASVPANTTNGATIYTVAVGSPFDSIGPGPGPDNSGSAYLFELAPDGVTWGSTLKLTAGDAFDGDRFGQAVAIGGDFLAVGAPEDDDLGAQSGSVYSFRRGNNTGTFYFWAEDTKVTPAGLGTSDFFGSALAAEQTTGVTAVRVIAGVARDDDLGNDAGAAYVFGLQAVSWSFEQKLLASDGGGSDTFGRSVALSGTRILVGADGDELSTGAAYLFELDLGTMTWNEVRKLTASDGTAFDRFGADAGIDETTLVAGAPEAPVTGIGDAGAAYVYEAPLFADGFESGDTSAWSSTLP